MTGDEAKTKWCPFVRQSAQAAHSNRGNHPNAANVNCIGSECMAWLWRDQDTLATAVDWVQADPTRKLEEFKARAPTNGYCGLAGNGKGFP